MTPYPTISAEPGPIEFFWFKVPYAIPGWVSFITGALVLTLAIYLASKQYRSNNKQKAKEFLSLGVLCFGFGSLGLTLSLRAVIPFGEALLLCNRISFFFVLLAAPGAGYYAHYITEQKYKILKIFTYVAWLSVLLGTYGLFTGTGFTRRWLVFSFGAYPKTAFWLTLWAAMTATAYFFVIVPCFIDFYKKHKRNKAELLAFNTIALLNISNIPNYFELDIYPGTHFSFIPMLILSYATFKGQYSSLNDFFYAKKNFFYVSNIIVFLVMLGFSLCVHIGLDTTTRYIGLEVIYLIFASFLTLLLGLFIARQNKTERLQQLIAMLLIIAGFYLLGQVANSMHVKPYAQKRIQQFFFIFFALTPNIVLRVVYQLIGKKLSEHRRLYIFDAIAIFIAFFTFSPYLYKGYHHFTFGIFSSGGWLLYLFVLNTAVMLAVMVKEYLAYRRHQKRDWQSTTLFVAMLFTGALFAMNLSTSVGYRIVPGGYFVVIPALFLVFYLIKNFKSMGSLNEGHVVFLGFTLLLLFTMALFYPQLLNQKPITHSSKILYIAMQLFPLLIFGYQISTLATHSRKPTS